MSACPYCGAVVADMAEEVAHMQAVHRDVIRDRLRAAGLHEQAEPFAHDATFARWESVRPSFPDDVVVAVRLRPHAVAMLRAGVPACYVRLDGVVNVDGSPPVVYDLYVETAEDLPDAVPAPDAPHSEGFAQARGPGRASHPDAPAGPTT